MVDEEGKDVPKAAPPEAPPPIITQVRTGEGRQWLMLVVYLLIALVVAGAVVLGGRWVYNQVRDEPASETATTTSTDRTAEPPAPAPTPAPGTTPPATPSPQPTPAPSPQTQGDHIANTGPGEVAAIFLTATLVAAGLHYIYQLRRTAH